MVAALGCLWGALAVALALAERASPSGCIDDPVLFLPWGSGSLEEGAERFASALGQPELEGFARATTGAAATADAVRHALVARLRGWFVPGGLRLPVVLARGSGSGGGGGGGGGGSDAAAAAAAAWDARLELPLRLGALAPPAPFLACGLVDVARHVLRLSFGCDLNGTVRAFCVARLLADSDCEQVTASVLARPHAAFAQGVGDVRVAVTVDHRRALPLAVDGATVLAAVGPASQPDATDAAAPVCHASRLGAADCAQLASALAELRRASMCGGRGAPVYARETLLVRAGQTAAAAVGAFCEAHRLPVPACARLRGAVRRVLRGTLGVHGSAGGDCRCGLAGGGCNATAAAAAAAAGAGAAAAAPAPSCSARSRGGGGLAGIAVPVRLQPAGEELRAAAAAADDADEEDGPLSSCHAGPLDRHSFPDLGAVFRAQRRGAEAEAAAQYHRILRAQRGVPLNEALWCESGDEAARDEAHWQRRAALLRLEGAAGDEGASTGFGGSGGGGGGGGGGGVGGGCDSSDWRRWLAQRLQWAERTLSGRTADAEAGGDAGRDGLAAARATGSIVHPSAVGRRPALFNTRGTLLLTAMHKLVHDVEQLNYLGATGLLPAPAVAAMVAELQAVHRKHMPPPGLVRNGGGGGSGGGAEADAAQRRLEDVAQNGGGRQYALVGPTAFRSIGALHNTLVYMPPPPPPPPPPLRRPPVLNPAVDFGALEAAYFAQPAGLEVIHIDSFLAPAALAQLRSFCLEATVFFDVKPGYLGAYVNEGFSSPLMLDIFEEMRERMPRLMAGHTLENLWAYKYDGDLGGIRVHADNAAVNFNLWLTPDAANLDPAGGGLHVYRVRAPADPSGGLGDWNAWDKQGEMLAYLARHGAGKKVVVPYRQNRVVIFNSDLLHETAPFRFKRGYENRRINFTMLFGTRPKHGQQRAATQQQQ
jgi:hypothetical protein